MDYCFLVPSWFIAEILFQFLGWLDLLKHGNYSAFFELKTINTMQLS